MTGHFVEHMGGGVGGRMEICLLFKQCQLTKCDNFIILPSFTTEFKAMVTISQIRTITNQTSTTQDGKKTVTHEACCTLLQTIIITIIHGELPMNMIQTSSQCFDYQMAVRVTFITVSQYHQEKIYRNLISNHVIFPFTPPFLKNKEASTLSAGTDSGISCR